MPCSPCCNLLNPDGSVDAARCKEAGCDAIDGLSQETAGKPKIIRLEDDIKAVLTSFSESIKKEKREENAALITRLDELYQRDEERFWLALEFAHDDMGHVVSAVVNTPLQKHVHIIPHIASGLYEHFIKRFVEEFEGSSCCADKSRFVKRMTLEALKQKKDLSLLQRAPDGSQAYWSPETIEDTDMAMELFWDWYLLRDWTADKTSYFMAWNKKGGQNEQSRKSSGLL